MARSSRPVRRFLTTIHGQPPIRVRIAPTAQPGDRDAGTVRAGDLVSFFVNGVFRPAEWVSVQQRVSVDGTVAVPKIGPVEVAGLTETGAGKAIDARYRDRKVTEQSWPSFALIEVASPKAEGLDLPDGLDYPVPDSLKMIFGR